MVVWTFCHFNLLLIFNIISLSEVFYLQRGTGLSTPLTCSSMLQLNSAENLADYLKHFRGDNIVKDAEFIRVRLVPDAGPWTVLGQVSMSQLIRCYYACELLGI